MSFSFLPALELVVYAYLMDGSYFQVTLSILKEGNELGIPAFWLQPGAEDAAVRQYVDENGLSSKVVLGGPCVLVDGDGVTRSLL